MGKKLDAESKESNENKRNKKGLQNTQCYEQKLDRQFPLKAKTKIKISGTNEREYSKNLPLKSYDKSSTYQFFSKKKRYDDGMKRNGAKLPMFLLLFSLEPISGGFIKTI